MKGRRRIGLFGTPCGGTQYLSHVLQAWGLDVGHERMRTDGIVCGFWVFEDERHKMDRAKPRWSEWKWDVLGVIVRHPLLVAETLPHYTRRRKEFAWSHEDDTLHALRYWVEAHERAIQITEGIPHVRIDLSHIDEDLDVLAAALGLENKPCNREIKSKRRRFPAPTWAEWTAKDPDYALRGRKLLLAYEMAP